MSWRLRLSLQTVIILSPTHTATRTFVVDLGVAWEYLRAQGLSDDSVPGRPRCSRYVGPSPTTASSSGPSFSTEWLTAESHSPKCIHLPPPIPASNHALSFKRDATRVWWRPTVHHFSLSFWSLFTMTIQTKLPFLSVDLHRRARRRV